MAMTNRSATNEIGGKSRRPTLMASQVELQTTQSVSQARGTFQPIRGRQLRMEEATTRFTAAELRAVRLFISVAVFNDNVDVL